MNAKEIFLKVKALFDAPAPTADPIPTPTVTFATYKLKDGSEISIAGETIEIGAAVTIGGSPAPSGDYILEDGRVVTVDSENKVSVVVTPEPITQPDFDQNKPSATLEERAQKLEEKISSIEKRINAPVPMPSAMAEIPGLPNTPDAMRALYNAFATGTPEERIANLELVAKALMEYSFGWQIREAEQKATADQAINIYKQGLVAAETKMASQEEKMNALFELVEKLVEQPAAAPVTLSDSQKEKFNRMSAKDERLKKISEAIKKQKALA